MARANGKTAVNGHFNAGSAGCGSAGNLAAAQTGYGFGSKNYAEAGRKIMKNIVLIGMPGCGKTTLGKLLAAKLKMEFYDADDVLEQREPYSIKEIFCPGRRSFPRS